MLRHSKAEGSPHHRSRPRSRRVASGKAAILTVCFAGLIFFAGAAQAATLTLGYGKMKAGDVWYGSYKTGAERGYCGDPIASGATIYSPVDGGGSSYGAIQTTTGWNPKTTGVGALSAVNVRRLAYVLSAHGKTNNNAQAAHVSYAVRTFVTSPGGAAGTGVPYAGDIKSGGETLVTEAKNLAGPYKIQLKITSDDNGKTASVKAYRPKSATEKVMTGYAGTLTISGPAVFVSNGAKTRPAPAGGAAVPIRATGDGSVQVTSRYKGLPSPKLHFRAPAKANFQRILISGEKQPVSGSGTFMANVPNSPRITTKTSTQIAAPGATITDSLHASGMAPNSKITVTSTLFGPFAAPPAEAAQPPANAPKIGAVTTNITANAQGEATATTAGLVVPKAGFYVWFETSEATAENLAWPGLFGQATETTLVKWSPEVTTVTSDQRVEPGATITDTLEVSGLQPGSTVDVISTLYGPLDERPELTDEPPANAPVVGTVTTRVTGDASGRATAITDSLAVEKRGFYVWRETIAEGSTYHGWTGKFGETSETTIVPWQPQVATQTSDQDVHPGAKITDTLLVSGLRPGSKVDITTTLYGPLAERPKKSAAPPPNTPNVGKLDFSVTGDNEGRATFTTEPLVVREPGFYVWHEVIEPTDEHDGWIAEFGQESETTLVTTPPTVPPAPQSPPPETEVPQPPKTPDRPERPELPRVGSRSSFALLAAGGGLTLSGGLIWRIGARRRLS